MACLIAPTAAARVPTCLNLHLAGLDDPAAWELWVASEIRRHPTHEPVEADCQATLTLEAFRVDGQLVLTAWFEGQVPFRQEVAEGAELRPAVAELLVRVLGTEPMALANDTDRLLARLSDQRLPLGRGPMRFGVEAFQTVQRRARAGDGSSVLPGVALRVGRELRQILVGVRVAASFMPLRPVPGDPPRPAAIVIIEPEFSWFASAHAPTTVYAGASLGLTVQHHVGYTEELGRERMTTVGAALGVRAGLELLRTSKLRVDIFTQATVPLHKTRSAETPLVDAWLPSVHMGAGVAF
ncbi:MAG: hypothetical protein R3F39_10695 [Myxococcota bacterium]